MGASCSHPRTEPDVDFWDELEDEFIFATEDPVLPDFDYRTNASLVHIIGQGDMTKYRVPFTIKL